MDEHPDIHAVISHTGGHLCVVSSGFLTLPLSPADSHPRLQDGPLQSLYDQRASSPPGRPSSPPGRPSSPPGRPSSPPGRPSSPPKWPSLPPGWPFSPPGWPSSPPGQPSSPP
ncbi:hypothetical protein Pcinc_010697 [Petrolisthes cinctipes]|uniref:Uncharacterized protein n=1 Tax=Petrolisthes cinctipes TaxID=88211 RepID=A0AAE1G277_PETCI|nr:hypothetical protein Pcinc_010697 [Petrolisthes cinctipes]